MLCVTALSLCVCGGATVLRYKCQHREGLY